MTEDKINPPPPVSFPVTNHITKLSGVLKVLLNVVTSVQGATSSALDRSNLTH